MKANHIFLRNASSVSRRRWRWEVHTVPRFVAGLEFGGWNKTLPTMLRLWLGFPAADRGTLHTPTAQVFCSLDLYCPGQLIHTAKFKSQFSHRCGPIEFGGLFPCKTATSFLPRKDNFALKFSIFQNISHGASRRSCSTFSANITFIETQSHYNYFV